MTKDEINKLVTDCWDFDSHRVDYEKFAHLVAAAERESCAVAVETQDTYGDPVGGWLDILATKIRQRSQS